MATEEQAAVERYRTEGLRRLERQYGVTPAKPPRICSICKTEIRDGYCGCL